MPGFRRAHLRGSEELFRPTAPSTPGDNNDRVQPELDVASPSAATARTGRTAVPSIEGNLLRLSNEEVLALADAIQRVKFPGKVMGGRPSVDDFERLEELRQKLLASL